MGSLNVQPPNALRNLTEVFIYFRNNKHTNRSYLNEGFDNQNGLFHTYFYISKYNF